MFIICTEYRYYFYLHFQVKMEAQRGPCAQGHSIITRQSKDLNPICLDSNSGS